MATRLLIALIWLLFIPFTTNADDNRSLGSENLESAKMEAYVPPTMPAFPGSTDELASSLSPYLKEKRPMDFFLEMYIVDAIEQLPKSTNEVVRDFLNRGDALKQYGDNWKHYVKSELQLSETIDTAIWDLWIRNSKNATENGWTYHPWHFAQDFTRNYFAEGSRVDVWEGNALELARDRIKRFRDGAANNTLDRTGKLSDR